MKAGPLRNLITIQEPTLTQSTSGAVTTAWSTFKAAWGAVEPLSGSERLNADQVFADMTHRVRIRYTSGVTTAMRLQFTSDTTTHTLEIVSIVNLAQRNVELELFCREIVS